MFLYTLLREQHLTHFCKAMVSAAVVAGYGEAEAFTKGRTKPGFRGEFTLWIIITDLQPALP